MVTIILAANDIPNGTVVHKVDGTVPYTLHKDGVKIFDEHEKPLHVAVGQCVLFGEHLSIVSPKIKLAVDFDEYEHAEEFLSDIIIAEQESSSK